jgi:hypothetical protein
MSIVNAYLLQATVNRQNRFINITFLFFTFETRYFTFIKRFCLEIITD